MEINDDDFDLSTLGINVFCPKCQNEMVHNGNSLRLAESATGALLECGKCEEITEWKFKGNPIEVIQVPVQFGGSV